MYKKWVRFYLHFCEKYLHNPDDTKSLPLFTEKLASKNQTGHQKEQALTAVEYYWILLPKQEISQVQSESVKPPAQTSFSNSPVDKENNYNAASRISTLAEPSAKFMQTHSSSDKTVTDINTGWPALETALESEIMLRHYSPKTLKAYMLWLRKFRGFLFNKNPSNLTNTDVKQFLTDLAVKKRVSASSQNQAFNALLFLFRNILKKELGDLADTPRAKRSKYVPTVLSK